MIKKFPKGLLEGADIPSAWSYYRTSYLFFRALFFLITIASIIAVFTTKEIKFFYPLIPLLLMLSISRNFKLLKENIKDAYMIAYHDNLEGEFTQQQMNIVFQDRAKRKSLNFIEMYSKPLFAQEKLLFFFEAMTMIGKTISILLFVVFPVLNWWLFLSLLVGFSILSYLLRISLAKWAFRRAIIRWVHKYHEQLNRNPPNKTSLLTKYNLREEDLNGWLEAQIRVLCMNNIHPDLAKIDELAPVQ